MSKKKIIITAIVALLTFSIIGGILAGGLASAVASLIANYITDDDADEMYKIIQELFVMKCDFFHGSLVNRRFGLHK